MNTLSGVSLDTSYRLWEVQGLNISQLLTSDYISQLISSTSYVADC